MFNKPKQLDFWQLSRFSSACKHPNMCSVGLLKCACVIWPCPKWHTLYGLVAATCTRLWRLWDCVVSQCHFRFQKGGCEHSLCGQYGPWCTHLLSLHWSELCSRLLPNGQSGIASQKCRLIRRPWVFSVPFGTGPVWQESVLAADLNSSSHSECFAVEEEKKILQYLTLF